MLKDAPRGGITHSGSDLLWLAAKVVVVSNGDHEEENSTQEQKNGGVGHDAYLHQCDARH